MVCGCRGDVARSRERVPLLLRPMRSFDVCGGRSLTLYDTLGMGESDGPGYISYVRGAGGILRGMDEAVGEKGEAVMLGRRTTSGCMWIVAWCWMQL